MNCLKAGTCQLSRTGLNFPGGCEFPIFLLNFYNMQGNSCLVWLDEVMIGLAYIEINLVL